MLREEGWRRVPAVLSMLLWVADHISRESGNDRIVRGWPALVHTLLDPLSVRGHSVHIIIITQLWIAVWGAHSQTVSQSVPLQRKLQKPLAEGASVLPLHIPLSLTVTPHYVHAGPFLLCLSLLRDQVLGVGFGFLIGGQLLSMELVQMAHLALGVQAVPLVLLALRLLSFWHLDVLGLLLSQALQRRARTARAPAAAVAASTQGLLLDGEKRASVSQVPVAELLLDETVQDRARWVFSGSHFSQWEMSKEMVAVHGWQIWRKNNNLDQTYCTTSMLQWVIRASQPDCYHPVHSTINRTMSEIPLNYFTNIHCTMTSAVRTWAVAGNTPWQWCQHRSSFIAHTLWSITFPLQTDRQTDWKCNSHQWL